ncbi:MAG TPA: hypothetical protein VJ123_09125 [Anaerolineales bacterium]|nr:hypothetical protein [Anaerolineales bacterium]
MTDLDSRSYADFELARWRGFFRRVLGSLSGHRREMLSYEEVKEKLRLGGPVYQGLHSVPLKEIIGSVNRYRDFDRLFFPTQSHTQDRWRRINRAWYQEIGLPPILLYKVGEAYFVIDGNHRVSVARSKGQIYIDAEVRECSSRVPLTAGIEPEGLERLGERVDFLERTRLDELQPQAQIETTVLGGYDRMIEHIAVHRYFLGIESDREVSDAASVKSWYDTLYAPVVTVVENSGVLEHFPGRTAADLYLWVMDHLHYLRGHPGQEGLDPVSAAKDFVEGIEEERHDERDDPS